MNKILDPKIQFLKKIRNSRLRISELKDKSGEKGIQNELHAGIRKD